MDMAHLNVRDNNMFISQAKCNNYMFYQITYSDDSILKMFSRRPELLNNEPLILKKLQLDGVKGKEINTRVTLTDSYYRENIPERYKYLNR